MNVEVKNPGCQALLSLKRQCDVDQLKHLFSPSKSVVTNQEEPERLCNFKRNSCENNSTMLEQSISSSIPTSNSLYLVSSTNGLDNGQPSTLSIPQCATSLGFSRFPNPSKIDDDNLRININDAHKMQPRMNPVSRRSRHFVPNERKDEYYWQKRKKNNEAARKSREKRRTIDSVLEEKVLLLSHENKLLRSELYALKLKHGEISADTHAEAMDGIFNDKANLNVLPKQTSHFTPNLENEIVRKRVVSPSPPAVAVPTKITIPQVSVILEKNGCSVDAVSSAKLMLSNLASGTLILSPVNMTCHDKATNMEAIKSNDNQVLSSKTTSEVFYSNEMKTVEAANTLATLFQTNGNVANGSDVPVLGEEKHDNMDSTSPEPHSNLDDASIASKKHQCLPHKLRFKCAKFE